MASVRWTVVAAAALLAGCFGEPGSTTQAEGTASSASSDAGTTQGPVTGGETTSGSGVDSSGSVDTSDTGCEAGTVDCACLPRETCLQGTCVDGTCVAGVCGDGTVDPEEDCDDSNLEPADGCSAACAFETQCFVGLFGGEMSEVQLASFSVDPGGNIAFVDDIMILGELTFASFVFRHRMMIAAGRSLHLSLQDSDEIRTARLNLDGTLESTGQQVDASAARGFIVTRDGTSAISWRGAFAERTLSRWSFDDEGLLVPEQIDDLTLNWPNNASALRMDLHPTLPLLYMIADPSEDGDNLRIDVITHGPTGLALSEAVDVPALFGRVRRVYAEPDGSSLVLSTISTSATGGLSTRGIARVQLDREGIPNPDAIETDVGDGLLDLGDLLPLPSGKLLFGRTDEAELMTYELGVGEAATRLLVSDGYHVLQPAFPHIAVAATPEEIASVGLTDDGDVDVLLDGLTLGAGGVPAPGQPAWFQAGVTVPCPDAR